MPHMTFAERVEQGKALRKDVPRSSHAEWSPPPDRSDPVDVLIRQDAQRLPWLVPIRHGRMAASPFTFYRGAAKIMAADLAATPVSGLSTQICGDAHLSNFGSFASPERRQVFDITDFDETLPGPWEWDIKRLAASFAVACTDDDKLRKRQIRSITQAAVSSYRQAMAAAAEANTLQVWYWHLPLAEIEAAIPKKRHRARLAKKATVARSKDSLRAASRLTKRVKGEVSIRSDPPLLIPLRDLRNDADGLRDLVEESLAHYRATLSDDRRRLLDRFRIVDVALKVVGVGSVGTRCFILLFEGKDDRDPLFLQLKEAGPSVLEDHLPKSEYAHHGQRVVEGQRLLQTTSDIFLGWSEGDTGNHYYCRQYQDMKGSADISTMIPEWLKTYARVCGWKLAYAHARAGDPVAIASYLGKTDVFDRAVTEYAFQYADQNARDYEVFTDAIASGRIEAEED